MPKQIAPFLLEHFTKGKKHKGKGNQYDYTCKKCQKVIEHLKDHEACPQQTAAACQKANVKLMSKNLTFDMTVLIRKRRTEAMEMKWIKFSQSSKSGRERMV
jgi:hypothetical protein